jgi:phage terminase small subunit
MDSGRGLTPKQEAFVREYLIDLNATQAAIRAGYSESTAAEIGYENLRKPQIKEAIDSAISTRAKRTEITADKVLQEIAGVAFAGLDAKSMIEEMATLMEAGLDGKPLRPDYNHKLKALELLGKHLKLFTEKHEHGGLGGGPIQFTDHEAAARLSAILNAARSRKEPEVPPAAAPVDGTE